MQLSAHGARVARGVAAGGGARARAERRAARARVDARGRFWAGSALQPSQDAGCSFVHMMAQGGTCCAWRVCSQSAPEMCCGAVTLHELPVVKLGRSGPRALCLGPAHGRVLRCNAPRQALARAKTRMAHTMYHLGSSSLTQSLSDLGTVWLLQRDICGDCIVTSNWLALLCRHEKSRGVCDSWHSLQRESEQCRARSVGSFCGLPRLQLQLHSRDAHR